MAAPDTLRYAKIPLTHGSGAIPALGFGTLIADPLATEQPARIHENFELSTLPEDAMQEIRDEVATRIRFNIVVETGVPGFIPRGR